VDVNPKMRHIHKQIAGSKGMLLPTTDQRAFCRRLPSGLKHTEQGWALALRDDPVEEHVCSGMPAVPPLSAVAALIGIDPEDPTNAEDYAVLRGSLHDGVAPVEQAPVERAGLDGPLDGVPRPARCARSVIRCAAW
jgi:hypothetical protein